MVPTISHNPIHSILSTYPSSSMDAAKVSSSDEKGTQTNSSDTISLRSESTLTVTYSSTTKLHASDEARYGLLRNLVTNLLKEQGINTTIASGNSEIDLAGITPEQAQELVGDNGYFGVEQTSDRIFELAVGIAGGDVSRIDAIKEGIDKGFAEAKKALGDWLPEISSQTYDAVMKKLDDWVAGSEAVV